MPWAAQPAPPTGGLQTSAPHVILMDAETQSILFQKNADDLVAPASTTKIMTADLVFEALKSGKLKLSDEFKVSQHAWHDGGAPAHGSTMFAALKSSIPVDDLLRGLLVVSGNDAAIILAEGLAGSEGAFATRMTERAHELGLTELTFTNAWGKDEPDQKVSARDMALLAAHIIKTFPEYYHYFGEKDFTWNKIKQPNRDPLLASDIGADGLKTGYIDANSGYSIVASAVQNGQRLILALYGAKTAKERADESERILQWGFRGFEPRNFFAKGDVVGSASVYGGKKGRVNLETAQPIVALVPRDLTEKITGRIVYMGPLIAPVEADKEVAHLEIFRGTTQILDAPLQTAESVAKGGLAGRAMDAVLQYVGDKVRFYIQKAVSR
ncbi:MAG TPA: D-alanyl-D-alanine carboxypeptidase family protein [Methylovirgula sp.]|jgi:D-alanyl-D-alanine carboxypeptidase (penicillin-binding protein 5/6)